METALGWGFLDRLGPLSVFVFRIRKPFLSKFITASRRVCSGNAECLEGYRGAQTFDHLAEQRPMIEPGVAQSLYLVNDPIFQNCLGGH